MRCAKSSSVRPIGSRNSSITSPHGKIAMQLTRSATRTRSRYPASSAVQAIATATGAAAIAYDSVRQRPRSRENDTSWNNAVSGLTKPTRRPAPEQAHQCRYRVSPPNVAPSAIRSPPAGTSAASSPGTGSARRHSGSTPVSIPPPALRAVPRTPRAHRRRYAPARRTASPHQDGIAKRKRARIAADVGRRQMAELRSIAVDRHHVGMRIRQCVRPLGRRRSPAPRLRAVMAPSVRRHVMDRAHLLAVEQAVGQRLGNGFAARKLPAAPSRGPTSAASPAARLAVGAAPLARAASGAAERTSGPADHLFGQHAGAFRRRALHCQPCSKNSAEGARTCASGYSR